MYLESYACALCDENKEGTNMHLFWDCPFALACWDSIIPNRNIGISDIDEVILARDALHYGFALDIIILGCWSIWSIRNEFFSR